MYTKVHFSIIRVQRYCFLVRFANILAKKSVKGVFCTHSMRGNGQKCLHKCLRGEKKLH